MSENLEMKQTERGFDYIEFKDSNGEKCSLQKSSAGTKECVWFGTEGRLMRESGIVGIGMIEVPLNSEFTIFSRMHLTRDMVRRLMPALQAFVETGDIGVEEVVSQEEGRKRQRNESESETEAVDDVQPTQAE